MELSHTTRTIPIGMQTIRLLYRPGMSLSRKPFTVCTEIDIIDLSFFVLPALAILFIFILRCMQTRSTHSINDDGCIGCKVNMALLLSSTRCVYFLVLPICSDHEKSQRRDSHLGCMDVLLVGSIAFSTIGTRKDREDHRSQPTVQFSCLSAYTLNGAETER